MGYENVILYTLMSSKSFYVQYTGHWYTVTVQYTDIVNYMTVLCNNMTSCWVLFSIQKYNIVLCN